MLGTTYVPGQSDGGLLHAADVSIDSPEENPAIPSPAFDAPTLMMS
jgi:hypothetical protein